MSSCHGKHGESNDARRAGRLPRWLVHRFGACQKRLLFAAFFLALYFVAHLGLRAGLPDADPWLLPLSALLTAMGLTEIYRLNPLLARDQSIWIVVGLGSAEEHEGKLIFKGTTQTQEEANKIWDAIKTIPDWKNEVVADIQATGGGGGATAQTYTVKPGDTLSKIAKEHLGDANAYMDIFNANKDQLKDPDKIKPGQVLKMPAVTKH